MAVKFHLEQVNVGTVHGTHTQCENIHGMPLIIQVLVSSTEMAQPSPLPEPMLFTDFSLPSSLRAWSELSQTQLSSQPVRAKSAAKNGAYLDASISSQTNIFSILKVHHLNM